jgi:hypothetical protein
MTPANPKAAAVLQAADRAVNGDRNAQYGPAAPSFERLAAHFTLHLRARGLLAADAALAAHDVAVFQCYVKLDRISVTPSKEDSWVDLCGYAGIGAECAVPAPATLPESRGTTSQQLTAMHLGAEAAAADAPAAPMATDRDNDIGVPWYVAPDWAKWWVQDENGAAHWAETLPAAVEPEDGSAGFWRNTHPSGIHWVDAPGVMEVGDWKVSLARRPDSAAAKEAV